MAMADDSVMFDGFDMKQFLCSSCRFLVSASKRYYQQNANNQQMIEFLQQQKFYDDLKVIGEDIENIVKTTIRAIIKAPGSYGSHSFRATSLVYEYH